MTKRRVLLCLYSLWHIRNLAPLIEWLASDGHDVRITCLRTDSREPSAEARLAEILQRYPNTSFAFVPDRQDQWARNSAAVRRSLDYLFQTDPQLDQGGHLRGRRSKAVAWWLKRAGEGRVVRDALTRLLFGIERSIPPDPTILQVIQDADPDVMVISPLIGIEKQGGEQIEYLKAAKSLGIPTLFIVHSWDNLSSKSYIRPLPDRIAVWNSIQLREAVRFHGVPQSCIRITGAQPFDDWFTRQPSCDRASFCRRIGIPAEQPYILYLGSALYDKKRKPEAIFVRQWLEAVRSAPSAIVRSASVVLRPHPKRAQTWDDSDFERFGDVKIWPKGDVNPADERNRIDFFDSVHHAAAVVALNTSAVIEAGTCGKAILTPMPPDHAESQLGVYHFRYLIEEFGGLTTIAKSMEEHVHQLDQALRSPEPFEARARQFIQGFVRPHGLDVPATPILGQLVLETAELPRRLAEPIPWWSPLARPLLWVISHSAEDVRIQIAWYQESLERAKLALAEARLRAKQEGTREANALLSKAARKVQRRERAIQDLRPRGHERLRRMLRPLVGQVRGLLRSSPIAGKSRSAAIELPKTSEKLEKRRSKG